VPWFRVDDSFSDHPKVEALLAGGRSDAAIALWTLAGSWCAKHLTDGQIPASKVARLGVSSHRAASAELVRVGLWIVAGDGFAFHQWGERQPSREAVTEKRKAGAARTARSRAGSVTRDKGVGNALGNALPTALVTPLPVPVPVPVPKAAERRLEPVEGDEGGRLAGRLMLAHEELAPGGGSISPGARGQVAALLAGAALTVRAELGAADVGATLVELGDEVVAAFVEAFKADPKARERSYPPAFLVTALRGETLGRAVDVVRMKHGKQPSKAWKGPRPPMAHVLEAPERELFDDEPKSASTVDDGRTAEERRREEHARKGDAKRYGAKGAA